MRPIVAALILALGACAGPRSGGGRPSARPSAPAAVTAVTPSSVAGPASSTDSSHGALPAPREGASPQDVARARGLVDQGVRLYREGQYTQAEDVLKQAITIYPFMADANLVLAKILLIRASATRDMTLYTNARLMLEMARALEPGSREIEQLLELVRQPTAE